MTITLQQAETVTEAAKTEAAMLGVPMNIAVVDGGGNLVSFHRQDGAWLGSIDIAQNKAFTARAFDHNTLDLDALVQPGAPLYGIGHSNDGKLITFPGGVLLKKGRKIIGAVGVSGGSVEDDHAVALAGAAAL